ncbi:hypothetical protein RFI_29371 [Reticulomyxa filosa]|uniref:Uncharacterized protein n=1 Tax=Reticulomyxa filosa TaxID=46433 RepID=X6M4Q2_RETFI|nr:hypothetical protein RFI_29371 [Reticulomyxa filosa]|eukprot:ETO08020.1 hypothetical protein RFI_29371 [Reticulomyxa filosa]
MCIQKKKGHYVSVKPHEGVVIEKQANANGNYFQILAHGVSEDDIYFVKPYHFQKENVVVIRHPHNGGIAVIQGKLSDKGTKDRNSRWIAIPQISNTSYDTDTTGGDMSTSGQQSSEGKEPQKSDLKSDITIAHSDTNINQNINNNGNNAVIDSDEKKTSFQNPHPTNLKRSIK